MIPRYTVWKLIMVTDLISFIVAIVERQLNPYIQAMDDSYVQGVCTIITLYRV